MKARIAKIIAFCILLTACGGSAATQIGGGGGQPEPERPFPTAGPTDKPRTSITAFEQTAATSAPTLSTTEPGTDSTQWTTEQGLEALAAAESLYQAVNAGDLESALTILNAAMPDAQTLQRLSIAVEAFGIQIESHCSLVDGLVECTEAVADDLFGPAGLIPRATSYYQFDDGQLFFNLERATSPFWCGGDPTGPYSRYLIDLRIWSAGAYPELESYWLWGEPIDSPLAIPCTFYPFRTPEAAQQIAPIISEFIDQSDEWPLAAPHGPGWGEGETEAALSTIDNLYAALNSGDVEAALDILVDTTSDERLAQMLRLSVDGLNAQFTYDCTPDPNLRKISCLEGVDDDLYGPAGITNESTVTYTYTRDKLIVDQMSQSFVCHTEPSGQTGNFLMGLRVWASNNHPELERYWLWGEPIDSPLAIPCTVYPFSRPESAIEIANIVSEFVAESTSWPIARP